MKMWKKVVLIIAIVMLVVGLGLLLFPPVSNLIGKQISKGQTETFDNRANAVISEGSDADTGVTAKTFQQALERKEVDKQGYPIDKNGNRTRQSPVLFAEDLERLWNDSVAYNEDLKTTQGSRFLDSDSAIYSALDLWSYGACDDIYQHRLSSAVGSHNGNMLTVAKTEIDGLCQPPGGHTRHSLFYVDNLLHSISLSSFHSSARNPSTKCNGGPYFQVLKPAGNGNRLHRGHPWHP